MARKVIQFKNENNKLKKEELKKITISVNSGKKELSSIQKEVVEEKNEVKNILKNKDIFIKAERKAVDNFIKAQKQSSQKQSELKQISVKVDLFNKKLQENKKEINEIDSELVKKREILFDVSQTLPTLEISLEDDVKIHKEKAISILDEMKKDHNINFEKLKKELKLQNDILIEKFTLELEKKQQEITDELKEEEIELVARITEKRKEFQELKNNYTSFLTEKEDKEKEFQKRTKQYQKILEDISSVDKVLQIKIRKSQKLETVIIDLEKSKDGRQSEMNRIGENLEIKKAELEKVNQEMQKSKEIIFGLLKREEKIKRATPLIIEYYKKAGLKIDLDM